MKKNSVIAIVAGIAVLAVAGAGGSIAAKRIKANKAESLAENAAYVEDSTLLAEEDDANNILDAVGADVREVTFVSGGKTYKAEIVTNSAGKKVTNAAGELVTKTPVEVTNKSSGLRALADVLSGNSSSNSTTKKSGSASTTKKASSATTASAAKKSSGVKSTQSVDGNGNLIEFYNDGTASIVKSDGSVIFNYSYSEGNGHPYFYTDDDPWQRGYGFNRLYDMGSAFIVLYYDTVRVQYKYGGYNWLVQMWKGQYGFIFLGSEIGIYYNTTGGGHYECAEDDKCIPMQMSLYRDGKGLLFTRPNASHWWTTGFVPGKLKKFSDRSELTMVGKLTFKSEAEAKLFCTTLGSLKDVDGNQFKPVSALSINNPETYCRSGNVVDLVWKNFDADRKTPLHPVAGSCDYNSRSRPDNNSCSRSDDNGCSRSDDCCSDNYCTSYVRNCSDHSGADYRAC